jgi:hypothetical protein
MGEKNDNFTYTTPGTANASNHVESEGEEEKLVGSSATSLNITGRMSGEMGKIYLTTDIVVEVQEGGVTRVNHDMGKPQVTVIKPMP